MTEKQVLSINSEALSWDAIRSFITDEMTVAVDPSLHVELEKGRAYIQAQIDRGHVIYGVNTGFGRLASVQIPHEELEQLQENLILSHAAGVGAPIRPEIVRLMLLTKIQSLSRGYSGVRPEILDALLFLLNNELIPHIPEKGSVGASGDLAPLAHMTLPLLGVGEVLEEGRWQPSADILEKYGRKALKLEAKEGLAIINGTQSMVAHGLYGLLLVERLLLSAELIVAATVDAMKGSANPFRDSVHVVKGSPYNRACASRISSYLKNSGIMDSHKHCGKVQDPYSLRCVPQVFGAIWEAFEHVKHILVREANAVSDNPLIFREEDIIVSAGNFHGESPALVMDYLAMAVSELASISERRTANLVDRNMSDLPAFLVENGGINSGYMIAHVTAAALVSENKGLAAPSSVDSIPTSANQEDHVSMGHRSAVKLLSIIDNTASVLAIECLAAMQGIEFRRPDRSSPVIEKLFTMVRKDIPSWVKDRQMNTDIEKMRRMLIEGELLQCAEGSGS